MGCDLSKLPRLPTLPCFDRYNSAVNDDTPQRHQFTLKELLIGIAVCAICIQVVRTGFELVLAIVFLAALYALAFGFLWLARFMWQDGHALSRIFGGLLMMVGVVLLCGAVAISALMIAVFVDHLISRLSTR
jgi:hypothetical protein